MQVGLQKPRVEISAEISKSNAFGIGDEKVVLEILRTKMYNDPIRVVVQEYISNGYDAHTEAGICKPVHVILPTQLGESAFRVRDYGNGISPSRVAQVFTKFGNSTKRLDNDQIGGFGLGAKSAFSYTDAFTVISISNDETDGVVRRKKRMYACYIDPSRTGKMDLMQEMDTSEPTGTEVIIPVLGKDFSTFQNNFFRLFQFFAVKPTFGGSAVEFVEPSYLQKTDTWALYDPDTILCKHERTMICTLGSIPYRINRDAMQEVIKGNENYLGVLNSNFIIFLKVGEVNISSNREDLYYDDKTKNAIKAKIGEIVSSIQQTIQESISKKSNFKDALVEYSTAVNTNKVVGIICNKNITYNGVILGELNYMDLDFYGIRPQMYEVHRDTSIPTSSPLEALGKHHIVLQRFTTDNPKGYKISDKTNILVHNNDGSSIISKDKLLTYFKKYGEDTTLFVITKRVPTAASLASHPNAVATANDTWNTWMKNPINKNLIDENSKDLGAAVRTVREYVPTEIILCDKIVSAVRQGGRVRAKIDITTAKGWYITAYGYGEIQGCNGHRTRIQDSSLYSDLKKLGLYDNGIASENVYIIRQEVLSKFTVSPDLKPIKVLVEQKMKEKLTTCVKDNLAEYSYYTDNQVCFHDNFSTIINLPSEFYEKMSDAYAPEFKSINDAMQSYKDGETKYKDSAYFDCKYYLSFINNFNTQIPADLATKIKEVKNTLNALYDISPYLTALNSKYPLLSTLGFLNSNSYSSRDVWRKDSTHISRIKSYIALINKANSP